MPFDTISFLGTYPIKMTPPTKKNGLHIKNVWQVMKLGEGRNNFPLTENNMRLTQDVVMHG